jgi:hypothetical protein
VIGGWQGRVVPSQLAMDRGKMATLFAKTGLDYEVKRSVPKIQR